MIQLHTTNDWQVLTQQARRVKGSSQVAVAYLTEGATKRLPLKRGSLLVVNMSERTLKAGLTNPDEVLKMLRRGVEVHSVGNLHAKVFVLGSRAFVGSANASAYSATGLLEAVLELSDRSTVQECRTFVESLKGELVTPAIAKRLKKIYRKPKWTPVGAVKRVDKKVTPTHERLWIVRTEPYEPTEENNQARKATESKAKKKLESTKDYRLDDFTIRGRSGLTYGVKPGDSLVEVERTRSRTVLVHPVRRVVYSHRYKDGNSRPVLVYLQVRKSSRRARLSNLRSRARAEAIYLNGVEYWKLVRNAEWKHRLLNTLSHQ